MVTQQIYDKIRYTLGIYIFKPSSINTHSIRKKLVEEFLYYIGNSVVVNMT